MALNHRQEKFCLAYAKSGNARQSYLEAGYQCKPEVADASASQLLKNPKVQARLAELYKEISSSKIADIREMQEILTRIIRNEEDEEIVVVEGCGDGCSEARRMRKEASLNDRIKAIEKLGKMQGAFVDKLNVDGNIPVVISGGEDLED